MLYEKIEDFLVALAGSSEEKLKFQTLFAGEKLKRIETLFLQGEIESARTTLQEYEKEMLVLETDDPIYKKALSEQRQILVSILDRYLLELDRDFFKLLHSLDRVELALAPADKKEEIKLELAYIKQDFLQKLMQKNRYLVARELITQYKSLGLSPQIDTSVTDLFARVEREIGEKLDFVALNKIYGEIDEVAFREFQESRIRHQLAEADYEEYLKFTPKEELDLEAEQLKRAKKLKTDLHDKGIEVVFADIHPVEENINWYFLENAGYKELTFSALYNTLTDSFTEIRSDSELLKLHITSEENIALDNFAAILKAVEKPIEVAFHGAAPVPEEKKIVYDTRTMILMNMTQSKLNQNRITVGLWDIVPLDFDPINFEVRNASIINNLAKKGEDDYKLVFTFNYNRQQDEASEIKFKFKTDEEITEAVSITSLAAKVQESYTSFEAIKVIREEIREELQRKGMKIDSADILVDRTNPNLATIRKASLYFQEKDLELSFKYDRKEKELSDIVIVSPLLLELEGVGSFEDLLKDLNEILSEGITEQQKEFKSLLTKEGFTVDVVDISINKDDPDFTTVRKALYRYKGKLVELSFRYNKTTKIFSQVKVIEPVFEELDGDGDLDDLKEYLDSVL